MNKHFYTVIMAGGVGSRFWPLSRQKVPKQFLDVLNTGKSLFQLTYQRFLDICPAGNIYVVANEDYGCIIKEQIPELKNDQILLEPLGRNTAPCIAYASKKIASVDPKASIIVAPSDHLILNESSFIKAAIASLELAFNNEIMITLGIRPNRPDTGYGYIQFNEELTNGDFCKVKTFTEKPDLNTAKQFVESGEFLWNAGIFIWNVQTVLKAFEVHLKEVFSCFDNNGGVYFTEAEKTFINKAYSECPAISIDYGIMEKATNVWVLPCDFGWSDIGTWNSLFELLNKDQNNNAVKGKFVILRNANNCIVNISDDKLLAVNNVSNLIIVESDNIILVADKNQEQDIRHVVNEIKTKYREKFI